METADVIVAGAGIIGLSVALELARSGLQVQVLERRKAMAEASWAAAGMLSVEDPEHPPALAALARLSGKLYPQYLRTVEELSGRRVPLRTLGTLLAASDDAELGGETLSREEAERRLPGVVTEGRRFAWLDEASLDPRDLCAALPSAAAAAGVQIDEDTEVLAVTPQNDAVAVTTPGRTFTGKAFVNCCGAWAGKVRLGVGGKQPTAGVEPRKGQMLRVRLAEPPDLAFVVRTHEIYLVPRGSGEVVVGATVERAGFDYRVEEPALEGLRRLASEVWPPMRTAPLVESWSGLRPGTEDDLPLIGPGGQPNCWVATGHFRNGILLAPATGLLIRQLVTGVTPEIGLAAFDPMR